MSNPYASMSRDEIHDEIDKIMAPDGVTAPLSTSGERKLGQLQSALETVDAESARVAQRSKMLGTLESEHTPPNEDRFAVLDQAIDSDEYASAFREYLQQGSRDMNSDQLRVLEATKREERALGTVTGSAGGFTVPTDFIADVVKAQVQFGGLRKAPIRQITTADGSDLQIPTSDDTGNSGELLSENAAAAEQDVLFGQKTLFAWTWSSKIVRVSWQLLQDSAVNMEQFLAETLGERLGRAQAGYLLTGTGSSQPEGIITNASTTAAGNAAILEYDDFVNIEHAVDPAYRDKGHYVLSDDALKQARLIKDMNDLPLWQDGMSGGIPASINGYSYTIDPGMASVATGNKPIIFGDISQYWLRDVVDFRLQRFDEKWGEQGQIGFLMWSRMDARPVGNDTDAYRVLQMA